MKFTRCAIPARAALSSDVPPRAPKSCSLNALGLSVAGTSLERFSACRIAILQWNDTVQTVVGYQMARSRAVSR